MTCAVCGKQAMHFAAFLGWRISDTVGVVEAVCIEVCYPWLAGMPRLFEQLTNLEPEFQRVVTSYAGPRC